MQKKDGWARKGRGESEERVLLSDSQASKWFPSQGWVHGEREKALKSVGHWSVSASPQYTHTHTHPAQPTLLRPLSRPRHPAS